MFVYRMCTVQGRTSAFADLEAKKEAKRLKEAAAAEREEVKKLVDKYRDQAHPLRTKITEGELTVDDAQKTPAGLAALIIGLDITFGHHLSAGEEIPAEMIKQHAAFGKQLLELERQVIACVLSVYCWVVY